MNKFTRIQAKKTSISHRKLIRGYFINDAWYKTSGCPIYHRWNSIISRCSPEDLRYTGCTLSEKWRNFSSFEAWISPQNLGWQIDKDLLILGNKLYGPDTCLMVPRSVNMLLHDWQGDNSPNGKGVSYDKRPGAKDKPWRAKFSVRDKTVNIGNYVTKEEAQQAYKKAKAAYVRSVASTYSHHIVMSEALLRFANNLEGLPNE